MNTTIPAVYENGVFRPVDPVLGLADGTPVGVTIQDAKGSEQVEARRSLTSKEVHELIKSKNPDAEPIPDELWDEIERATEIAMSNVRDPEVMRKAAERMDRRAEEIDKRQGLLDIAVPGRAATKNEISGRFIRGASSNRSTAASSRSHPCPEWRAVPHCARHRSQ